MGFLFIFRTRSSSPRSRSPAAPSDSRTTCSSSGSSMSPLQHHLIAAAVCVIATALLWRNIEGIGRLAVVMLVGVIVTIGWVIVAGLVQLLAGAGVRLSSRGAQRQPHPAREHRRHLDPGDVQLRRLQPGLLHRRRDHGSRPQHSPLDPALDLHRRRALHADDDRHPRHDSVAGSARLAHDRVALHRAHLRRSVIRPHRRHRDDDVDPVRGGGGDSTRRSSATRVSPTPRPATAISSRSSRTCIRPSAFRTRRSS